LSLQFITTYLPRSIREDNRLRLKCILSLLHIPLKDIITSIDLLLSYPDIQQISASTVNLFLTNSQDLVVDSPASDQVEAADSNELILPSGSKTFIDILLHKYLLLYLSIDGARIAFGFHSSQHPPNDHFAAIHFPFLDKQIMKRDVNCLKQAQINLNMLSLGNLFSSCLQDYCWFRRDGVMKKYPLTFKGFVQHLLDSIETNTSVTLHPINKLPLELFSTFDPPIKKVTVQSQVGKKSANCVICAINNLFGKACVAYESTKNQQEYLNKFNKTSPIYLKDLKIEYTKDEMDNFGMNDTDEGEIIVMPGFTMEDGCSYNYLEYLIGNKLGCDITEISNKEFNDHKSIKNNDMLVGLILISQESHDRIGHYFAMRKVPSGNDPIFILIDSYEEFCFGLFRYDDIITLGEECHIYAVSKTDDTWSKFDFMDMETNAKDVMNKKLPFVKYSKFLQLSGMTRLMSESYSYLSFPDNPSALLLPNTVSGQKRKLDFDNSNKSKLIKITGHVYGGLGAADPYRTPGDDGGVEKDNNVPNDDGGGLGTVDANRHPGNDGGVEKNKVNNAVDEVRDGSDDKGHEDKLRNDEGYDEQDNGSSYNTEVTGKSNHGGEENGRSDDADKHGDDDDDDDGGDEGTLGANSHPHDDDGDENNDVTDIMGDGGNNLDDEIQKDKLGHDDGDGEDNGNSSIVADKSGKCNGDNNCGKGGLDTNAPPPNDDENDKNDVTEVMDDGGNCVDDEGRKDNLEYGNGDGEDNYHSEDSNNFDQSDDDHDDDNDDDDDDDDDDDYAPNDDDDGHQDFADIMGKGRNDIDDEGHEDELEHCSDEEDNDNSDDAHNIGFNKLPPMNDGEAALAFIKEMNTIYNDCMSLRESTERIIEIDIKKFNEGRHSSDDDLRRLLRLTTELPNIAIIFTEAPDIGREMLDILLRSNLGSIPTLRLSLYNQGILLGSSSKLFSLNYLVNKLPSLKDDGSTTYEINNLDGVREVVKIKSRDLSMYYKDLSTQSVDPRMMELYDKSMPKLIRDMSPFQTNDFSKYVSVSILFFTSSLSQVNSIIFSVLFVLRKAECGEQD